MTTNAEPRRCPMCLRWEHGSGACYPAYTNTPVSAPEQQQGEPVCARCGHTVHGVWCTAPLGRVADFSRAFCTCSAPPSSEEAEAQPRSPELVALWKAVLAQWTMGDFGRAGTAMDELEAAIRSPLGERVRELEALVAPTTAAKAWSDIREERDRLRGLLQSMHAAGEVDGRNAIIARAEAAEAQVAHGAALAAADGEVIDHLRAQVAKLRESIDCALWELGVPDGSYPQPIATAVDLLNGALAETVQEGGETGWIGIASWRLMQRRSAGVTGVPEAPEPGGWEYDHDVLVDTERDLVVYRDRTVSDAPEDMYLSRTLRVFVNELNRLAQEGGETQ